MSSFFLKSVSCFYNTISKRKPLIKKSPFIYFLLLELEKPEEMVRAGFVMYYGSGKNIEGQV